MTEDPYRKFMNYALRALTRRAHTSHELREKFKKRPDYSPELEERVIARLFELKLLDDDDYIRRALNAAAAYQPQGRLKLLKKLSQKGLLIPRIQEIWGETKIDEETMAYDALKKAHRRFERLPEARRKQRQINFLVSRGFSPHIIYKLVKSVEFM